MAVYPRNSIVLDIPSVYLLGPICILNSLQLQRGHTMRLLLPYALHCLCRLNLTCSRERVVVSEAVLLCSGECGEASGSCSEAGAAGVLRCSGASSEASGGVLEVDDGSSGSSGEHFGSLWRGFVDCGD